MAAQFNRTDLMDSSRLPGEAAAETQGEASRRAGVVSETPSPRPARPPVVRRSERPDEPVQAGLPGVFLGLELMDCLGSQPLLKVCSHLLDQIHLFQNSFVLLFLLVFFLPHLTAHHFQADL